MIFLVDAAPALGRRQLEGSHADEEGGSILRPCVGGSRFPCPRDRVGVRAGNGCVYFVEGEVRRTAVAVRCDEDGLRSVLCRARRVDRALNMRLIDTIDSQTTDLKVPGTLVDDAAQCSE